MTIYKDVNGREFTYNEYWNKIYLDEKRPHVDHLTRHKWPEEKPTTDGEYLVRLECGNKAVLPWYDGDFYLDDCLSINYIDGENPITHWWDLPGVT